MSRHKNESEEAFTLTALELCCVLCLMFGIGITALVLGCR